MLSLGVETWSKSLRKVGFTRKARVLLGLQGQTPGFQGYEFMDNTERFPIIANADLSGKEKEKLLEV